MWAVHTCECDPCPQGLADSVTSLSSCAAISPQFLWDNKEIKTNINQNTRSDLINNKGYQIHTRQVCRCQAHRIHIIACDVRYSSLRLVQNQLSECAHTKQTKNQFIYFAKLRLRIKVAWVRWWSNANPCKLENKIKRNEMGTNR